MVTAITISRNALTMEKIRYGNCLPSRNSVRVSGVTYRLVMEPISFSRTTDSAARMAGIIISRIGMVAGTMAGRLATSGLYR